jgi:hypothetical protein
MKLLYSEGYYSYYSVILTTDEDNSYELIVPIMTDQEDSHISKGMENLEHIGNCTFRIIKTEYGHGLQIIGHGNISLVKKLYEEIPFSYFSLESKNSTESIYQNFWIFHNFTNPTRIDKLIVVGYIEHNPPGRYNTIGFQNEVLIDFSEYNYTSGWNIYKGGRTEVIE